MTDLSTAEANARAAIARDPKECVAITAEEACALFDRLTEAEATLAIVRRDFSGPVRPTHHRCPHCVIAAGDTERAWIDAEQYALKAWKEHLASCPHDPNVTIISELRDKLASRQPELMAARAEIAQIKRDRDERLSACVRGEQHQRERNADLVALLAEAEARMHAAEGEVAQLRQRIAQLEGAYR